MVKRVAVSLPQNKIEARTMSFFVLNTPKNVFAKRKIAALSKSIRISSGGHSSVGVESTPTSSRGRVDFKMPKAL
jgi:hypothetical protein